MKIEFDDKSYISVEKSSGKIFVSIAAKSAEDPLKLVVNSVELTAQQLLALVKSAN